MKLTRKTPCRRFYEADQGQLEKLTECAEQLRQKASGGVHPKWILYIYSRAGVPCLDRNAGDAYNSQPASVAGRFQAPSAAPSAVEGSAYQLVGAGGHAYGYSWDLIDVDDD